MLIGKNLRRRHDTGLETVVHCQQATEQCHKGLTAADIALQETIHLLAGLEVGLYLTNHAFLCVRKVERQGTVEGIESLADNGHGVALILLTALHLP